MKAIIVAGIVVALAMPTAGDADNLATAMRGPMAPTHSRLIACSTNIEGRIPSLAGQFVTKFRADGGASADEGIEFDIAQPLADSAPIISAHAINTKGTGTAGRAGALSACAGVAPTPVGRSRSIWNAHCYLHEGDELTVQFDLPLSAFGATEKNYTGHVTLMKRGDSAGAAKVVAPCTLDDGKPSNYDLAIAKG